MSEINLIKEEPITMAEVNVILEKIKKRDKELIERATKTH